MALSFAQLNAARAARPSSEPVIATPSNPIQQLTRQQKKAEENIASEVRRIVDLPVQPALTDEEVDLISWRYLAEDFYRASPKHRFFREQAAGIAAYYDFNGAFLPIAVGGGKTLTSLAIANIAFSRGHDKILLLVPSPVLIQLVENDLPTYRKWLREFCVHTHVLAGHAPTYRRMLSKSNKKGLYIATYSMMSSKDASEVLDAVQPTLIICDEAHNVSGARSSARAKRFKAYVNTHNPEIVALSGTITRKSPIDYHYLSRAALKDRNFLPNAPVIAEAWSMLIDSNAANLNDFRNDARPKAGPIMPLVDWAAGNFPEDRFEHGLIGFRKAYKKRLETCPGVITSVNVAAWATQLFNNHTVTNYKAAPDYDKVEALVAKITNEWVTPNGDEIEHAMHIWKWRYEIEGAGFYNELFWPTEEKIIERKQISANEAKGLLERSKEYHARHQDYAKELRNWLQYHAKAGLDTPHLIGLSMHNHGAKQVSNDLFAYWSALKAADFEGRIERDGRAVRVCDYKIKACTEWVLKFKEENPNEGVLVWFYHQEVGRWLMEYLEAAGLDVVYCPAGKAADRAIIAKENHKKVVVASLGSKSTGLNLQHFGHAYYAQWPRDAILAEQSLGRLNRAGQARDEVNTVLSLTNEFDMITFGATLNDAAYIHQTIGNKQMLIYGNYTFKPKVVPYAVLRQWGTDARMLDKDAKEILEGRFEGEK